jgi:hypothetical protein
VFAKASDPCLRGLFELGKLPTLKSSLITLDFVHRVSKSTKKKLKKGFAPLCYNYSLVAR